MDEEEFFSSKNNGRKIDSLDELISRLGARGTTTALVVRSASGSFYLGFHTSVAAKALRAELTEMGLSCYIFPPANS